MRPVALGSCFAVVVLAGLSSGAIPAPSLTFKSDDIVPDILASPHKPRR
jgi:hypothetical protein